MTESVPIVLAAQQNAFACYDSEHSIATHLHVQRVIELLHLNWHVGQCQAHMQLEWCVEHDEAIPAAVSFH